DVVNPGAQLAITGLALDLPGALEFALTGSVTGLSVVAAPVTITGAGSFTLVRQSVDVDTDGNGAADLIGARLDALALDLTSVVVTGTGVGSLTGSGQMALASVTPAGGTVRYTALKMGTVLVNATLDGGFVAGLGFTGTLNIDALDYNAVNSPLGGPALKRLDWASAFDLDGDGQFGDVVNPGAQLAITGLALDLPGALEFALTGSVTGLSVVAAPVTITGDA